MTETLALTVSDVAKILRTLEPGALITTRRLRYLDAGGVVRPSWRTKPSGMRLYTLSDVVLLRALLRLELSGALGWQARAAVAYRASRLVEALAAGEDVALVLAGGRAHVIAAAEAAIVRSGFIVPLSGMQAGLMPLARRVAGRREYTWRAVPFTRAPTGAPS